MLAVHDLQVLALSEDLWIPQKTAWAFKASENITNVLADLFSGRQGFRPVHFQFRTIDDDVAQCIPKNGRRLDCLGLHTHMSSRLSHRAFSCHPTHTRLRTLVFCSRQTVMDSRLSAPIAENLPNLNILELSGFAELLRSWQTEATWEEKEYETPVRKIT